MLNTLKMESLVPAKFMEQPWNAFEFDASQLAEISSEFKSISRGESEVLSLIDSIVSLIQSARPRHFTRYSTIYRALHWKDAEDISNDCGC